MNKINDKYNDENEIMGFIESRKNTEIKKAGEIDVKNLFPDDT